MLQISKKNTVSFRDEVPEKWNHSLWTQRDSFSVSLHLKFLVIFLCHWAFIFLCGQMLLHILFIYYPIYFTVGTNFSWKLKENFSCSFKKLFKTSIKHSLFQRGTHFSFNVYWIATNWSKHSFWLIVHFILDFTTKLTYTQAFKQEM